jgi:protein arginine kinase activator
MVCQQCNKREANVHYTQIINGKKVEMYLCTQCAAENGTLSFDPQLSLGSLLWGFPVFGESSGYAKFEQPEVLRCNVCGMSFDDFRKGGKLGCPQCYSVFRDNLAPILRRLHGSTEHTGKTPDKASAVKKTEDRDPAIETNTSNEIERLKAELSKAIECEHYEKAAELRDRIRSLENSGNANGGVI